MNNRILYRSLALISLMAFTKFYSLRAQTDSLVFNDGNIIIGVLESMENGVLTIKTDFSDSDFKIEWKKVEELYVHSRQYVAIKNGKYFYGKLRSKSDSVVMVIDGDSSIHYFLNSDIVEIQPVNNSFDDKFESEIDVGFNLAKANELKQMSIGLLFRYSTDRWKTSFTLNSLYSRQEAAEQIDRIESEYRFGYIVYNNWYLIPAVNYLSNTEQQLLYRWNTQLGVGNYLIRTNRTSWSLKVGVNNNLEKFDNEQDSHRSWEGIIGTELDLFDFNDLELFFSYLTYPSFVESGRWRIDGSFRLKYDLPLDFYLRSGFSLNYDNQPSAANLKLDYVASFGFGWEW